MKLRPIHVLEVIFLAVIVYQYLTIERQAKRIENFQEMVNSIPADYRTQEGKRYEKNNYKQRATERKEHYR